MPTARSDFGLAVANGKIYAIGGYNGSYLNVNEMYDPVTDTWTTKTPMPTPRAYFAVATYRNKIYAIAGSTGTGSSTLANEVYDTITDTWETLSPLQSDTSVREHLSANVVNGKIYVISGIASVLITGFPPSAENNVYDPALDVWTRKAPIPQPVFQYASAVIDDKIFIIGGRNYSALSRTPSILSLTQIYDTTTDTWTNGASMPTAAYWSLIGAATGLFAPKRIYIFGGYTTSGPGASWLSITHVYNPVTNAWTTGTIPPADFARGKCAVVNDVFYAIGDDVNLQYTPIGYEPDPSHDGTAPEIAVLSPENMTYYATDIQLTFTVNEPVSWIQYNLDYKTVREIESNFTLSGLSLGSHNVTVYATDIAGNIGYSETVYFTIAEAPEPFPTTLVIASVASVAVVSVGLLVYLKKRKR
jgi:N-acetylneuraminic acid mutarotase